LSYCAYVNEARIRSCNQPVLSNEGRVYCSMKQREPLVQKAAPKSLMPELYISQTLICFRHVTIFKIAF